MKEVGQYFKEHFNHFDPEIPSDMWNKMKNDQSLQKFNRLQSVKRVLLYGVAPMATIAILIGILVFNSKHEPTPTQVVSVVLKEENQQSKQPIQPANTIQSADKIEKGSSVTSSKPQEILPPQNNVTIANQNSTSKETGHTNTNTTIELPKTQAVVTPKSDNKNAYSTVQQKEIPKTKPENTTLRETQDNVNDVNPKNTSTNPDPDKMLFIPTGFTPNNDGHNDQFFVTADWEVCEFEIIIFQRGGGIVFKTKDINLGWDGTFNGTELPQGAYAYMITYKNSLGDSKRVKGTINLIR
ncbi:MAG: gliding motility-associated C-terminal protein [Bacteroidetes bacterium]|nr:gliding motility-associated C-terminal protein [Bacteroidota bacterium]